MYHTLKSLILIITILPCTIIAISGGSAVQSSKQYPFSVTLTNPILCGGSIISLNPPWILTAAHCIESFKLDEEDSSLAYGSRNFSQLSYARIKQVVSHPMYMSAAQLKTQVYTMDGVEIAPYDIALVQLTEPLVSSKYVNRIRLDEPFSDDNNNNTANSMLAKTGETLSLETIGMGYTGVSQPHATMLQYAVCNSSDTTTLRNNNFNHSIILSKSNAGLCHGDSGSPLLYKSADNEYSLTGILNRIMNAYDPDPENLSCPLRESNMTGFTNVFVRASSHMKWISEVTGLSQAELTASVVPADDTTVVSSHSLSGASHASLRITDAQFVFALFLVTILSSFLL